MANKYKNLRKNLDIGHESKRLMRFLLIPLVAVAAFFLVLKVEGVFTLQDLSIFLTVASLLFGLLATFTISRGWERVSIIRQQANAEISAYMSILSVAKKYNRKVYDRIAPMIRAYIVELASTNFKDCPHSKKLDIKFSKLFEVLPKMKIKKQEDWTFMSSIVSDLKTAYTARNLQNAVVLSPLSHIRLEVLYLLSVVIVGGFFLTERQNELVSALTTAAITSVVVLLLILVIDLDNLSYQYGHVTQYQYESVLKMIDSENGGRKSK